MKDNCFTEFCCFLSSINMNQPQVYLCPLPLEPPSPPHPSRLLQRPGLNSLSHTANSHWLSILHMVMYMFQCYSLKSSHPLLLLLGMYPKEARIERDTCTPMFIAAVFTIARTWKQPRCPSADEWIRKLWYITMEYYNGLLLSY